MRLMTLSSVMKMGGLYSTALTSWLYHSHSKLCSDLPQMKYPHHRETAEIVTLDTTLPLYLCSRALSHVEGLTSSHRPLSPGHFPPTFPSYHWASLTKLILSIHSRDNHTHCKTWSTPQHHAPLRAGPI